MVLSIRIIFYLCILCAFHGGTFGSETDQGHKISQYDGSSDNRDPGNILIFHPFGSKSHLYFIRPLAERLAKVGHNVTLVQYSPSTFQHENFKEILIENKLVEASSVDCIK